MNCVQDKVFMLSIHIPYPEEQDDQKVLCLPAGKSEQYGVVPGLRSLSGEGKGEGGAV